MTSEAPTPSSLSSSFLDRQLQTLAVAFFVFMWLILPIITSWLPFYLLFTPLAPLVIAYGAWFVYDFRTPARGSRPCQWMRKLFVWKYYAAYFPMKLVKTADLDPQRNYILGSHPHGVFCCGVFGNICTEATGIGEKFPGLTPYVLTLNGQFYYPFRREFGMSMGGVESSRKSLRYLLSNPEKKGRMVTIVLGGAEEVLDAHSGQFDLKLASRKGFCRFALKYGADLVPMFHFGENDVFVQSENSRGSPLRSLQVWIKDKFGFCPPLIVGASLFPWRMGVLPQRRPITTVVGAPIRVEQAQGDPTPEQIDDLHERYCEELKSLFDEHKKDYGISEDSNLNIY